MIEQQGQVIQSSGDFASVRLGGRSGCAACDAGRGCGAGVFGKLLRRRPLVLDLDNHLGAQAGQAVIVGVPESWFLRLTARFYLIPLLAGLGGAAFGHHLSVMMQSGPGTRDLLTLTAAVAAAASGIRWGRSRPVEFPGASAVHLLRFARGADPENA